LQAILIQREMKCRHALAQVGVDGPHHGAGGHDLTHLRGDIPQHCGVGAHHPKGTGYGE